jgi:hypothetical protein
MISLRRLSNVLGVGLTVTLRPNAITIHYGTSCMGSRMPLQFFVAYGAWRVLTMLESSPLPLRLPFESSDVQPYWSP